MVQLIIISQTFCFFEDLHRTNDYNSEMTTDLDVTDLLLQDLEIKEVGKELKVMETPLIIISQLVELKFAIYFFKFNLILDQFKNAPFRGNCNSRQPGRRVFFICKVQ